MKRKRFIQILAAGIGISAIPGIWFLRKDVRKSAIQIITHELRFLPLDAKGVEQFVDDYLKIHTNSLFKNEVKAVSMLAVSASRLGYTEYLVRDYLLSSTFFKNKMDESQTVHYSGTIYSPYNAPCGNPFSFIYYPANAAVSTVQ